MTRIHRDKKINKADLLEDLQLVDNLDEWHDAVNNALYHLLGFKDEPETGIEVTTITGTVTGEEREATTKTVEKPDTGTRADEPSVETKVTSTDPKDPQGQKTAVIDNPPKRQA